MLIAAQTISFPRPIVNVCSLSVHSRHVLGHMLRLNILFRSRKTNHPMANVVGVCVQKAIRSGIVTSCVHRIRAGFVEGGLQFRHVNFHVPVCTEFRYLSTIPETSHPESRSSLSSPFCTIKVVAAKYKYFQV